MNKEKILTLYRYNAWSNAKIISAASEVTREQYLLPAPVPHGSLRGTLVHALSGELIWRKRWEGKPQNPSLEAEEFPSFGSLRARWADEEARLMEFVSELTDVKLSSMVKYISTEGFPHERLLWETMLHLVNHGTQHKTEAAGILTGFGHSPGDIDLIVYLNGGA